MNTTIEQSSPPAHEPDFEWRHVAELPSSNDALLAEPIGESPALPVALRVDRQTAGRGRRGRRWISEPASALTFSLAFERQVSANSSTLAGFSLAVGIGLCETLRPMVPGLALKWPNDLLRDEGKVGGILIEARRRASVERTVVGIGLNLLAPAPANQLELAPSALEPAGLFDVDPPAADAILRQCAYALRDVYAAFCRHGFGPFQSRWMQCDAYAGRPVRLIDGERELAAGRVLGVDAQGALELQLPGRVERFSIGELSLRPIAAARQEST